MSEEDIKLQYITPSIVSKWSRDKITMETLVTDGKINLKGNFVFREKPKRADYILYLSANNPIQFIEENISLIDEQCFKASPHNCVCGLRPIFCPIRAVIKGGNTYSIPALL